MSKPLGWLVWSKQGFVRAIWHIKPSDETVEICRHDGDTITALYANDCTCQEKWTFGVVHRKDAPCYIPDRL